MGNYLAFFDSSRLSTLPIARFEMGFSAFTWIISKIADFQIYVGLITFLVWVGVFRAILLVARSFYPAFIVTAVSVILFTPLVSLYSVVLRQGLASAIALLSLPFVLAGPLKSWRVVAIFGLVISFHNSAVIFIVAAILVNKIPVRAIFCGWMLIVTAYILGVSGYAGKFWIDLFDIDIYVLSSFDRADIDYTVGFKWKFLALSLVPLIAIIWATVSARISIRGLPRSTQLILGMYFVMNSIAMMFALSTFHDRMFIWSWIFIPVAVCGIIFSVSSKRAVRRAKLQCSYSSMSLTYRSALDAWRR